MAIKSQNRTSFIRLPKGDPAVQYSLLPSTSSIKRSMAGVCTPSTVGCQKMVTTGGATVVCTDVNYVIYYQLSTMDSRAVFSSDVSIGTAEWIEFTLFYGSTMLDLERISVLSDATDINVGGRNLLLNSADIPTGSCATNISAVKNSDKSVFVSAKVGNENWWATYINSNANANLVDGEEFIIIFWVKSYNATGVPKVYIKNGIGYYPMTGSVTSEYSPIYYKGKWKSAKDVSINIGFSGISGQFTFKCAKLCAGNAVVDWSPAPEDLVDESKSYTNTQFNVLDTKISGKVETSTYDANNTLINNKFSSLEATDSEIKTQVSNVEKGVATNASKIQQNADSIALKVSKEDYQNLGRNLLLKSGVAKSGTTYHVGHWIHHKAIIKGKTYTCTIKGSIINSNKEFGIWLIEGNYYHGDLTLVEEGIYTLTFTANTSASEYTIFSIYLAGNQLDGDAWTLDWIQLEEGSVRTQYKPAPEDTDQAIANAQNSANSAQSAINAMNDDGICDISEKQALRIEWEKISNSTTGSYNAVINAVGAIITNPSDIPTVNATNAYNALSTYLTGISLSENVNSTFTRSQCAGYFSTYYKEETALWNAIASFNTNNVKSYAESQFTIRDNEISQKVGYTEYNSRNDVVDSKFSQVKTTTDGITATVADIQNTANGNKTAIATVNQRADGIEAKVTKAQNDIVTNASKIQQNADSINVEVVNRENLDSELRGLISVNADNIKLKVSKSDYDSNNTALNTAIANAQSSANSAQSAINAMNDDGTCDISEKQKLQKEWLQISDATTGSYPKVVALATERVASVSALTELDTPLVQAYNALNTYLTTFLTDMTVVTTGFSTSACAGYFASYYSAEKSLWDKLAKSYTSQRNLLLNTNRGAENWSQYNDANEDVALSGTTGLTALMEGSVNSGYLFYKAINIDELTTGRYTLRLYARASRAKWFHTCYLKVGIMTVSGTGVLSALGAQQNITSLPADGELRTFDINVTSSEIGSQVLYFSYSGVEKGVKIVIKDMTLYKGIFKQEYSPRSGDELLDTGIDIYNKRILMTADKTIFRNNLGVKMLELTKRGLASYDNKGRLTSTINEVGDGTLRLYYPDSGRLMKEEVPTYDNSGNMIGFVIIAYENTSTHKVSYRQNFDGTIDKPDISKPAQWLTHLCVKVNQDGTFADGSTGDVKTVQGLSTKATTMYQYQANDTGNMLLNGLMMTSAIASDAYEYTGYLLFNYDKIEEGERTERVIYKFENGLLNENGTITLTF